jgi:hypothetical protein
MIQLIRIGLNNRSVSECCFEPLYLEVGNQLIIIVLRWRIKNGFLIDIQDLIAIFNSFGYTGIFLVSFIGSIIPFVPIPYDLPTLYKW